MRKLFLHSLAIVFATLLVSCGGTAETKSETEETTTTTNDSMEDTAPAENLLTDQVMEKDGLKIYPMQGSTEYPEAKLVLQSPAAGGKLASGSVDFEFRVISEEYELGAQTPDATERGCANSGKGQHIHLILNNEPYSAHYESSFSKDLEDGHYVALSFISRSYHESIKTSSAYQLFQFTVGDVEATPVDLSAKHVIYSRPKGEYTGDDAKKVMLDFYLLNTDILEMGNRVKATINGKTEILIAKWQPYFIEGLPMGENTIKLELVDQEGNLVEGGMNTVERKFTLADLK